MRTDSKGYSYYLENKYLPGRRLYLNWLFYPKISKCFRGPDTIIDLGCGTGEFLNYCKKRKHDALGVDSNETLAAKCRESGFNVIIDNVCQLTSLNEQHFTYAVCDNVLEHLDMGELHQFIERVDRLLVPGGILVCIVPGIKGFKSDPTHKTYVCYDLLTNLLEKRDLRIETCYYHPVNLEGVHKYFYLNMQVFEIRKI
jgi:SAM-dependent methyltransferase